MKNIIEIKEDGNRLDFLNTYSPIVCGNSNYILKFTFSEPWQKCIKKAAIFVIGEKKITIDFDGDECEVPTMPNGDFVFLSIISNDGINQMTTTGLRIRLETTVAAGDFSEYDQVASYLSKLIGEINKISNGEIVAKLAEKSLSQVDLDSNQEIEGIKNFVGGIQKNGIDILNKSEIANPNLLINGDFRVNQRGKESYSGTCYGVDRWQGSAYLAVTPQLNGGVVLNADGGTGYFVQRIEDADTLWGKTITMQFAINGIAYFETGTLPSSPPSQGGSFIEGKWVNGAVRVRLYYYASSKKLAFTFDINDKVTITIDYAKLEIGEYSTTYSPRTYAEELALCQRYYEKIDTSVSANKYNIFKTAKTTNRFYEETQIFMCTKRTLPTIHCYSAKETKDCLTDVTTSADVSVKYSYITANSFRIASDTSSMTVDGNVVGYFEADAEIY